jgi:hypothetical protein
MGRRHGVADPIDVSVYVDVTNLARRGLGREHGRAGMCTTQQIERHLTGIVKDELRRLEQAAELHENPDEREDDGA